jgi:hypothetical protein
MKKAKSAALPSSDAKTFRNRIQGFGTKRAADFKFNAGNYRRHGDEQRLTLRVMLTDVGWAAAAIENVRTGNLIDGHARIEEALREDPDQQVPYLKVDLSESEEKAVLLSLDPISTMADIDPAAFEELYQQVVAEMPELEGIIDGISAHLFDLGEHEKTEMLNNTNEWVGMPEFEPGQLPLKIIINFETEKDRHQFAAEHKLEFLQKQSKAWTTWYPFKERADRSSLRYEQADS